MQELPTFTQLLAAAREFHTQYVGEHGPEGIDAAAHHYRVDAIRLDTQVCVIWCDVDTYQDPISVHLMDTDPDFPVQDVMGIRALFDYLIACFPALD